MPKRKQMNEEGSYKLRKLTDVPDDSESYETALYDIAQSQFEPSPETANDRPVIDLTKREVQVLRLMAQGLTNPDISSILSISPHTVKTHVIRIFDKLGVSDRTQASTLATRLNLI